MMMKNLRNATVAAALVIGTMSAFAVAGASAKAPVRAATQSAYLQITLDIAPANRGAAAAVYMKYKKPFLAQIPGARSKQLLVRDEDVQVLHGFDTAAHANAYLKSKLFNDDVVVELKPFLRSAPDVRVYSGV